MTNYKLAISFYGYRKGTKVKKVEGGYLMANPKKQHDYFFSDKDMEVFLRDKIFVPIKETSDD